MKEWDSETMTYIDQKDDEDDGGAKVKIKLTGPDAKALIKEMVPKLRKTKKKGNNNG